jgi:DMSO/TMAO reductase YedYZ molybdopterin-dependent catalytic subunit
MSEHEREPEPAARELNPAAEAPAEPPPSEPVPPEPATAATPPGPSATSAPELPAPAPPARSWIAEPPEVPVAVPRMRLAAQSRRDFLLFGAGLLATVAGTWWLLPDATKRRWLGSATDPLDTLAARVGLSRDSRERALNRALTFDDDVAEALYSKDRGVRTYSRSQITPLRNNYHGRTPRPEALAGWALTLSGLASGRTERLAPDDLRRLPYHEQVTRLVCVEGWSAVAWWGGIRFADLLAAFPPAPGARWAALRSTISLDGDGNPEPYYVSIDLGTARHPQTLLATHQNARPLTLEHGAPLRLLAPMKLGLKNIKGLTDIAYVATEPADYWNEQGYSKYDGL